jgi:amidase
MTQYGHEVTYVKVDYKPTRNDVTLYYEMKHSINKFFEARDIPFIKNLSDIINLNTKYHERTLKFGQTLLERSNETSGNLEDVDYIKHRETLLEKASIFNETLSNLNLDALVSVHWFSESPIFGQPSIVVPAKAILDNNPKSLVFIGKKYEESVLLDIAYIYESKTQKRKDPMLK